MDLARIELNVETQSYSLARFDVAACCTGRLRAQYLALVDLFEFSASNPRKAVGLPLDVPLNHKRIQTAFRCGYPQPCLTLSSTGYASRQQDAGSVRPVSPHLATTHLANTCRV